MLDLIKIEFIFIPFATRNVRFIDDGVIGYTEYYFFGIRFAKIQKTIPWEVK